MNFFDIPGNESIKKTISAAFDCGRLSHAIIISGGSAGERMALARNIAAAVQCSGTGQRPCMECINCRKVMGDIHPDVEMTDPEGSAIKVETARNIQKNAHVRPNEGARHVFIIGEAGRLNTAAQNILLKTLEEPPGTAMFILTVQAPGQLLSTIRSRCVNYHLTSLKEERAVPESSRRFMEVMELRSPLETARFFRGMEKTKREEMSAFIEGCSALIALALRGKYLPEGEPSALTPGALVLLAQTFQKADTYNKSNCGVGHLCGFLAVSCWEALN